MNMTDNKLTDEQIIKAMECCAKDDCESCPLSNYDGCKSLLFDGDIVLDLINRLKSQNKEFDEKIVIQMGTIDWQAKEINRQKAEIAELQQKNSELESELKAMRGAANSYKTETEILQKAIKVQDIMIEQQDYKLKSAKSEAIKEFAERLKSRASRYSLGILAITDESIDNLVKEMVGEQDV